MKTCSKCRVAKPIDEYYFVKRTQKHTAACKQCTCVDAKRWREANPELFRQAIRKNQLLRQYGISIEEYDALRESQRGACAICGATPVTNLHVDHDHTTGKVRGLLCRACNTALGMFQDDASILGKAIDYITATQGQ